MPKDNQVFTEKLLPERYLNNANRKFLSSTIHFEHEASVHWIKKLTFHQTQISTSKAANNEHPLEFVGGQTSQTFAALCSRKMSATKTQKL